MSNRLANNLVLVFTAGVSIQQWAESGLLTREWALYRALLADGWYDRLTLVTYGGPDDDAALAACATPDELARTTIISNDRALGGRDYVDSLPARVHETLAPDASVVVKTNQMHGGDVAVGIVEALRRAGHATALIARGGYLWSRFVAHEHGPSSRQAAQASQRESVLCRAADVVIGTTPRMIEDLSWRHELDPSRAMVVPNYVVIDHRIRHAADREAGMLLYAGQLVPRKRVDVLIRAVHMLPRECGARLTVVGAGPSLVALDALAKDLNAPVSFLPRVPHEELLGLMGRCAAYVQASDLEGHPKTVLEAMASGAPVIVADMPGLGVVVRHGATGLKVAGDAQSFSHAIEALLMDEEWREVLGATAAQVARAQFGLPTIVALEREAHERALAVALVRQRAEGKAA